MICPVCHEDMMVVEYRRIELDHCVKCRGAWFDSGELELLAQSMGLDSPDHIIKDILASPEDRPPHPERKCPVCHKPMREKAVGDPPVHIDACRQGDGLWFDGGEAHQLLKQLSQTSPAGEGAGQIAAFVGEVFHAEDEDSTGGGQ
ncbi:MAG: zf-TFIIB domain-containing protein [Chloroflexi bacterium]|nr:zf-TFIIB domain-containing protein [Chloroflexota bacterium]